MRLVLDARTAALAALIDYAGRFPPASLPMEDAVATYRRLRTGPQQWVVGRFLCRATELDHLAAAATPHLEAGERPWPVGVVYDTDIGAATSMAAAFQREMSPAMTIDAVEVRMPDDGSVDGILDAIATIDAETATYVEVDRSLDIADQIGAIGSSLRGRGRTGGAKLRCGGLEPAAFPSPEEVATFIAETTEERVPFKATAGLHQPIRHFDAAAGVWRHGFVNLLAGTAAAAAGEDRSTIESIVSDDDADAFSLNAVSLRWRGLTVAGVAIRNARLHGFTAYGSCDIDEPLEALATLGFLGEGS